MPSYYLLIIFVFGLILGSFFNVVGLRVPKGESVIYPASHCPKCQKRLRASDLIPVVSYLINRGRCKYCRANISILYPLGELLTALLFVWISNLFGFSWGTVVGLILVSLSVIVTISDLTYMLIPNKVLLIFLGIITILRFIYHPDPFWNYLFGAAAGGGILLLIALLSRGGMGMGDVKLFFLFGAVIGFPHILVALFLSSLLGSIIGLFLLLLKVVHRKQGIPFGPFLAAGTMIAYAYGDQILAWYATLLGS
jgi:leader peptidase (prepilin peptidase)/N-methyltransferase